MRTVFLGTPAAAVPTLRALHVSTDVVAVFTQPDRPRGRSGTPQASEVKLAARELGLDVIQPERSPEIASHLTRLGPIDVAVIVAFGLLVRPGALAIPDAGFVNVHFSLLPRWRGAAPVQRAMLAGDERSGVTLMQLDEGLDTGPTLATLSTEIGRDETGGTLTGRLSVLGAELVRRHLTAIVAGSITPVPQPVSGVTLAPKLDGSDRRFIAGTDAETLRRSIMAMAPAPGLTADRKGGPVKLLQAGDVRDGTDVPPGSLEVNDGRLWCSAVDGRVEIRLIQSAGRRPVTGIEWARGQALPLGRLE